MILLLKSFCHVQMLPLLSDQKQPFFTLLSSLVPILADNTNFDLARIETLKLPYRVLVDCLWFIQFAALVLTHLCLPCFFPPNVEGGFALTSILPSGVT